MIEIPPRLAAALAGREPVWSPDGRTLYYRNRDGQIMAADWDSRGSGGVLSRRALFDAAGYYSDPVHSSFDIHPDGTRFLMIRLSENVVPGVVWAEDFGAGLARAGGG
jgi:Tol biopolymer transport system component